MTEKAYIAHENVYQSLRERGLTSWNAKSGLPDIEAPTQRFFKDVLGARWGPSTGAALELGCGTAPLLRWLAGLGWKGTGIDISPTAIDMAREFAVRENKPLDFRVGDATDMKNLPANAFDLVSDGQCFHCLIEDSDRHRMLDEVRRVLQPDGCFVLNTMARPILPGQFKRQHGMIRDGIIFCADPNAKKIEGAREINGEWMRPTRRLAHWKDILALLRAHGMIPQLHMVSLCNMSEPLSFLSVAAKKKDE